MTWLIRSGKGIGVDPAVWQVKASVFGLWSDFLFANIGADFTIFGMIGVIALFCWFGYRAIGIALNAPTRFGSLLATGLTAWIIVQAGIHMGASLTLFPATGQPLPFMSYGGSSLVSCMIATGMLLSISRSAKEKKSPNAYFAIGGRDWRPRLPHFGGARSDPGNRGPQAGLTPAPAASGRPLQRSNHARAQHPGPTTQSGAAQRQRTSLASATLGPPQLRLVEPVQFDDGPARPGGSSRRSPSGRDCPLRRWRRARFAAGPPGLRPATWLRCAGVRGRPRL